MKFDEVKPGMILFENPHLIISYYIIFRKDEEKAKLLEITQDNIINEWFWELRTVKKSDWDRSGSGWQKGKKVNKGKFFDTLFTKIKSLEKYK